MSSSPRVSAPSQPLISVGALLFILGTLSAFGPFATDMYLSSFPLLAEYFQTSMAAVSMSLSVYFIGLAGGQLLYGPLIDRYGRKPLLLAGIFVFSITSVLIIFAPSIESFVALRFLQAIGSCSGMIIARAIVSDLFDEQESARFFSLMSIIIVIGPILAPSLGGYLVAFAGWKAIFIVLALCGAGCFLLVQQRLPETLHRDNRVRATFRGILATYAGLLLKRHFILPTLVCSIAFGELFAFIGGSPFVYMTLHGVSVENYGLLFSANAVGAVFSAKMNHSLLKYFPPQRILWWCVGVNLFFALVLTGVAQWASLSVLFFAILFTLALVPVIGANAMALALGACPETKGSASAMLGVLQFGVAALSSALVGLLHNGTVYPMVGMILGCSVVAALVLFLDRNVLASSSSKA